MTQASAAIFKIRTESPQPPRGKPARSVARAKTGRQATGQVLASGTGRAATRGDSEVIELEYVITVYPVREEKGRWRAVWYEDDKRQQCEAATEDKLAAELEKVTQRLAADAPNMKRPGADLIAWYLSPDRLPIDGRWSRKHAHTQRRLCERFAAPVINAVTCQDIKTGHMQKIVNTAPTPGEGARVQRMVSALVSVGLDGGYLANPRLAKVHWQAGDRELPVPKVSVAGESGLWVGPSEIPSHDDITRSGWSVLVSGRAEVVEDDTEIGRLSQLGLYPWASALDRPFWIRSIIGTGVFTVPAVLAGAGTSSLLVLADAPGGLVQRPRRGAGARSRRAALHDLPDRARLSLRQRKPNREPEDPMDLRGRSLLRVTDHAPSMPPDDHDAAQLLGMKPLPTRLSSRLRCDLKGVVGDEGLQVPHGQRASDRQW